MDSCNWPENGQPYETFLAANCPDEPKPERELGFHSCSANPGTLAGNPIVFPSGNKLQREFDYSGQGTLPLVFDRHYNSTSGTWSFAYSRHLEFVGFGVKVHRDDGKVETYFELNGVWSSDSDNHLRLEEDEAAGIWHLIDGVSTVETYHHASGRLRSITNRAGQSIALAYDASDRLESITHYTGRTLTLSYTASDQMVTMTDPAGHIYRYSYDAQDRLAGVSYPDDTPADPSDKPTRQYHYEDPRFPNALTGITDENGDRFSTWEYDAEGRAVRSEHAGGVDRTDVAYNADGTVSVINPLLKENIYTLITQNGLRKVSQIDGQPTVLCGATASAVSYDVNGYVSSRTDENGNVTNFTYNARGLLEVRTEAVGTPNERTIATTWHLNFRVPTQIVEPGRNSTMTYDASGRLLTRTITDTQTQTVPYTTIGNERTTTFSYNALGLIATIDGPRTDVADVTMFSYDANGDLVTVTNALGHTTRILARDAHGNPLEIRDPNGLVTALAYDARQRLVAHTVRSAQGDAVTTFTYDAAGRLVRLTPPNGAALHYEYDSARRLTAIANALGERIEYQLDAAGNPVEEVIRDASGSIVLTQTRVFDALSRLRESVGGADQRTTFAYDDNDNPTETADPLGHLTGQSFDALDRLIVITDPERHDVGFAYDDRDNLTEVTDQRGITTTFVYDAFDQLIQEASPDAGTTVHHYDAAGNLIRTEDARGIVTDLGYDALNRLVLLTYPDSPEENVRYTYDEGMNGIGRLSSLRDGSGTITFTYDDRGNIVQETRGIGGELFVTDYAWDLADQLVAITYPSGRNVQYTRDGLGRIGSVVTETPDGTRETVAADIGYLPFGDAERWTLGNGVEVVRRFDADYRLTEITATGPDGPVQALRYDHDPRDLITAIDDQTEPPRSQAFDYDPLQRLTRADGRYGIERFSYDPVGNRLTQSLDDGAASSNEVYAYETDSNRLRTVTREGDTATTARSLGYSQAGNVIRDRRHDGSERTLIYNARNRLVAVRDETGVLARYQYNALGQRVVKDTFHGPQSETSGRAGPPARQRERLKDVPAAPQGGPLAALQGTIYFHYDLSGQLIAESNAAGKVLREYIYADGGLLGFVAERSGPRATSGGPPGRGSVSGPQQRGPELHFFHTEHLGTPQLVTDHNAQVVWQGEYRAFGEITETTNAIEMPLRFPGQYADAETGLYYNYFRDYDPASGRYLESDPIGLSGGLNRYAYAAGSPTNLSDWLGLAPGDLFSTREEALADAALYIDDKVRHPWVAEFLFGVDPRDTFIVHAYQVEGCWTYSADQIALGIVPVLPGRSGTVRLRNSHLAGGTHPITKVPFDSRGFPDFRAAGVVRAEVKIVQTGKRRSDARAANLAAGYRRTPKNHVWHHHQDGTTMQLVPAKIHIQTGHTGGVRLNR